MIEYVTIVAQTATGMATLAVAIFLAAQLRLQRKDSQMATQTELTSGIVQWIGFMITDPVFTHIYLRAIEGDSSLNKEERHRFNVFMVSYFFRIQQLWEYDNKSDLMMIYANIILGTGPGVVDWYQNMGRFVLVPRFQDFIDELLDE
ncbi:MAG TPA: hypothetical protein DEP04_02175 [Dehalococcoidia bacterium]|nr:hypothetical protein [Chloroflexota bacterium]HCE75409.1 hypothetical protein [Dehalococcoidia bacterium]|tara:strand:+ start:6149 stop:6589 length:441 start_codon:yes stop_codon:yes gene_type:complete